MGRFAAVGALALGVICISTSAVLVLLANVGAPASAFYRLGFAAVVLVPVWLVRKRARSAQRVAVAPDLRRVFRRRHFMF